eukprot:COSAG01_NODE_405_length_17466_cov_554.403697_20_plen_76_part_00
MTRRAAATPPRGESKRLVVESPWSQFTSECQRFGHPPRLDKTPFGLQDRRGDDYGPRAATAITGIAQPAAMTPVS